MWLYFVIETCTKAHSIVQLTSIDGVTMPEGCVLRVRRVGVTLGQGSYTELTGLLAKPVTKATGSRCVTVNCSYCLLLTFFLFFSIFSFLSASQAFIQNRMERRHLRNGSPTARSRGSAPMKAWRKSPKNL